MTPEYRKSYEAGWRYSGTANANLDYADRKGLSSDDAWMDGYLDQACGDGKWFRPRRDAGATVRDHDGNVLTSLCPHAVVRHQYRQARTFGHDRTMARDNVLATTVWADEVIPATLRDW